MSGSGSPTYGRPMGAPPPPPMYGGGFGGPPVAPMAVNTEKALKYFYFALLCSLINVGISLISQLLSFAATTSPAGMGLGCLNGLLGLVSLVLGISALVYFIMALVKFFQGKDEFGPKHAKNVKLAITLVFVLIGLGIFMVIAAVAFIFIMVSSILAGGGVGMAGLTGGMIGMIVVLGAIGIAMAIINYAIHYLLVADIALPEDLTKLKLAIGLSIAASLVFIVPTILFAIADPTGVLTLVITLVRILAQGAVQALFVLVYYNTHKAVKKGRITGTGGGVAMRGPRPF